MNGIDIAGHQKGINLADVPCDFVIIKATQGKSFVNPEFTTQITQALSLGKYVGVYHYANGVDVDLQVNHFVETIKPYLGKVLLALDWEGQDNPKFSDYKFCERLLVGIKEKTGITPFLYMSKSVCRQYKWEVGRQFPLWAAQYANKNMVVGYRDNPWTDNKGWGAWSGCKIYQYTGNGRLNGYSKALDLDLCYMDGSEWLSWASGDLLAGVPDVNTSIKPTLKKGDRNECVRAWQIYLNANGYNVGKAGADGIFGDDTERAVVKFQQDHGMEAGYIGPQTWETIQ